MIQIEKDNVHFAFGDGSLMTSRREPINRIPKINIRPSQSIERRDEAPDGDNTGGSDVKNDMAKSIVEYIFLGLALLIVTSIILRRFTILKRRNQPYTSFFGSDTPADHHRHARRPPLSAGNSPNYTPASDGNRNDLDGHLARYPATYFGHGQRRTHANDIDASGRRLGNTTVLDHDGELGDKDALPAYDNVGGPPKYNELELQYRLTSVENGPSHPADQPSNRRIGGRAAEIPTSECQTPLSLSPPRNSNDQGDIREPAPARIAQSHVE